MEEEVFEFFKLGHVRLHESSLVEHLAPGLQPPQLEAEAAQEPHGRGRQLHGLEVLGHGLHVRGLEHHGHHGAGAADAAQEPLDRGPDVVLPRRHLQDLLHPHPQRRGLGEEGGHGGVRGGDERDLGGPDLGVELCKRLIGEVVQSRRRPLLGPSPG